MQVILGRWFAISDRGEVRKSRPWWFVAVTCLVAAVNDGYSGKPSPLLHQLILLPITALFVVILYGLLHGNEPGDGQPGASGGDVWIGASVHLLSASSIAFGMRPWILLLGCFELLSLAGMGYERHHFARFGYSFAPVTAVAFLLASVVVASFAYIKRSSVGLLVNVLVAYAGGLVFAIEAFPLNYLRSDMLPVIFWADGRLLSHLNPYDTMHVGTRLYDFPYLPGMLVAYLPAVAMHMDVRTVNLSCCVALAALLYVSARPEAKADAVALVGVFLLCPFLQYRHDLYLQPHWLALTAAVVLLRFSRNSWAALIFGVSMALYQLSWVLFPFLVLYAFQRQGWREALKATVLGIAGLLLLAGPFLRSASARIASNTVGQWGHMRHALADPMNLSYWLTFLVRPDRLKWVQLAVLTGLFGYCLLRQRCQTLVDTLRWMSGALTVFVMMNVLVDGYFFLTLLLLLLMYTFAATGVWPDEAGVGGVLRVSPLR